MSRLLYVLLALALVLTKPWHASGQGFPMLQYTVEDGLPSNNVYALYRDSKGYIWLGTDKGVARYNGVEFEVFSTFSGLPDNEVFLFREDKYGRLWLGTFNGELCYYKDGSFHTSANTKFLRLPFIETHTRHISVEQDGSVIVGYNNPKKFLVINNEICKVFDIGKLNDTGIANSMIFARKLSENEYELTCSDKVVIIDTLYHVLSRRRTAEAYVNKGGVFTSCQNQDYYYNNKHIFTFGLAHVRDFPDNFVKPYFINEIYFAGKNAYYATNKGLYIDDSLRILNDDKVSSITQDEAGNYWISTLNRGLFVLKKDYKTSVVIKHAYERVVRYATSQGGLVFFATADNKLYELTNGKVKCLFDYAASGEKDYDYSVDFGFLVDSQYRYHNIYNDDYVVIDNLLKPKASVRHSMGLGSAKEIYLSQGYVYLKLPHNVVRFEEAKEKGNGNIDAVFMGASAHYERIFDMAEAPDKSIWYATFNGMYRVDSSMADGVIQEQFKDISLKWFGFFGDYLVGYTHKNQLLVCSNYNGKKIKVDHVAQRNCIWDKLYQIDAKHILISTNNLYRLLTIEDSGGVVDFSVHAIENPFLPLHAEAICCDGQHVFFFKGGAITEVANNSLFMTPAPPKLFFSTLKTNKNTYPMDTGMVLSYSEAKNVSITFSTISQGSNDVLFQYSASKGEQDNWSPVANGEINLVNPSYGVYTIKVRAKTISSDYCKPIVYTLYIERPYWATLWFGILAVLLAGGVVVIVVRLRILHVLHKKERQHDTEIKFMRSEYKALNALMNPHFIFNTLNNVQGLVNRNDKRAANEYIRIFADLIRQNMHNISKDMITLQKEIELVTNYLLLEKLRFKEQLNYSVNIDDEVDLSEIMVPPLLVQPLVENSIKHGILPLESGGGKILINVYERAGVLYIEVKDNGVGIMNAQKNKDGMHESFGLDNIRQRITQLGIIQNKQITFTLGEEQGVHDQTTWTIVTIGIPYEATDESRRG